LARLGRLHRVVAIATVAVAAGATAPSAAPGAPRLPFISEPGERVVRLEPGDVPLADVQRQLDDAHRRDPDAFLVVTMAGRYAVADQPLRLASRTCVLLTGTLAAAPGATAPSLVAIRGASKVSIAGGVLDGRGAPLHGVEVIDSGKVSLDGLTVRGAGRDGIHVEGPGEGVWTGGTSITGCDVGGSGGAGIVVAAAARALCLGNRVHGSAGAGVELAADRAAVVGNVVTGNGTGIRLVGDHNAVSDNQLVGNLIGLELAAPGDDNVCFANAIEDSRIAGAVLGGTDNLVHATRFHRNARDVATQGGTSYVVPASAVDVPGDRYFFPPTPANPHRRAIVNGRGRSDVAVTSVSLADVQRIYDAARADHPGDVVVLHLSGSFQHDGPPLVLDSYTSVVLDGAITSVDGRGAVLATRPGARYVSIAGGTIECRGRGATGIALAATMGYVEGVTIRGCGDAGQPLAGGAIHLAGGGGHVIVRGCRIEDSGGRGIWTDGPQARYLILDNDIARSAAHGIDLDRQTLDAIVCGNRVAASGLYGLFVEEGASRNLAYDNRLDGNAIGASVYANAGGAALDNTLFGNQLTGNGRGLRLGSNPDLGARRNVFFRNAVAGSAESGIHATATADDNYMAQNALADNRVDLDVEAGVDFFNPPWDPAPAPPPPPVDAGVPEPDASPDAPPPPEPDAAAAGDDPAVGGCGCATGGDARGGALTALALVIAFTRARRANRHHARRAGGGVVQRERCRSPAPLFSSSSPSLPAAPTRRIPACGPSCRTRPRPRTPTTAR